MRQEFSSYQRQKKESVQVFLFGCLWIFIYLLSNDTIKEGLLPIFVGISFMLHSIILLHRARKSILILDYDGIKLIMPLIHINTSWQNISVVDMKVRDQQELFIYSPDMIIKKTRLGNLLIPSNMEEDMVEKGIPISKYLGNDLDEIMEILSTYPQFRKKNWE